MALQLTIIKFPPGTVLGEDRKTFGPLGGLIGRGVDNDWVLSDPERFLSSKHCQVVGEGNRYFLVDLSTNGTFLNGAAEPLGRGSRVALNDGDYFDVGEYRFKVALEQAADPFGSSPFGSAPTPFIDKDPFATGNFAFAQASSSAESMFMSGDYKGSIQDIAPDAMKITDPLIALDNANKSVGISSPFKEDPFKVKDSFADPFASVGSHEDSPDPMSESISWPETKQAGSLLPEDWADDISLVGTHSEQPAPYTLPDDDSLIKSKPQPQPQFQSPLQSQPQPKPQPQRKAEPEKESALSLSDLVQSSPNPQHTGRLPKESAVSAVATPRPGRASEPPATTRQDAPPRGSQAKGTLDRTLLEALGLGDENLSDDQVREIHHTVGLMMRETIDGLMQVLRSRTSIKNEFRINITTIQPVENNPIKFSVSVDEVMDIMFVRKTRAYKAPLDAVQESFHSIADHQLAVIAGIRSAFRSVLSKFDPEKLEEEFKQTGKGGMLPGVMKGRLWNAYQDHYQKMVNDMERSFQELFGDEFVQAYEDQMRKLASARKRDL